MHIGVEQEKHGALYIDEQLSWKMYILSVYMSVSIPAVKEFFLKHIELLSDNFEGVPLSVYESMSTLIIMIQIMICCWAPHCSKLFSHVGLGEQSHSVLFIFKDSETPHWPSTP